MPLQPRPLRSLCPNNARFGARPLPGCIAPLPAAVAHSALELGLLREHLLGHVRPALSERCGALCGELDRLLVPLGCAYHRPAGGYFVWLELPEQVGSAGWPCPAGCKR